MTRIKPYSIYTCLPLTTQNIFPHVAVKLAPLEVDVKCYPEYFTELSADRDRMRDFDMCGSAVGTVDFREIPTSKMYMVPNLAY